MSAPALLASQFLSADDEIKLFLGTHLFSNMDVIAVQKEIQNKV
jgi:hypothetical protein